MDRKQLVRRASVAGIAFLSAAILAFVFLAHLDGWILEAATTGSLSTLKTLEAVRGLPLMDVGIEFSGLLAKSLGAKGPNGSHPVPMPVFRGEACSDSGATTKPRRRAGAPMPPAGPHSATGDTPLHRAALMGRREFVDYLLAHGTDVSARNIYGETPLHLAAYGAANGGQYPDVITDLVRHHADLLDRDNAGWTPLHHAAAAGKLDIVKALIDAAPARAPQEISAKDAECEPPLYYAAFAGHEDVVNYLVDKGATVAGFASHGEEPLGRIICGQSKDKNCPKDKILKLLLKGTKFSAN